MIRNLIGGSPAPWLAFSLLIGACAAPVTKPVSTPQSRIQSLELAQSNGFQLSGRVAVKYDEKNFSGGVRWAHNGGDDEIWILAPLGTGVARIVQDANGISLITSKQETYRAHDAESLTREVLGWSLPLSGLQYWVLGIAAPQSVAYAQRDSQQRLAHLNQDSWEIAYLRYKPEQESGMPARITLSRGDLQISLIIDDWIIPPLTQ
ncbi:MAG TPA: lipoprotein insertase outer membrane protein LolB [Burkholderiales bacterium]|nr:lipoprotein insertase outer membrane protein LolB [Burkholderiales bacterium]